ncbi:TetR/AcrR family transcriptional regulator [Flagellimonas sp. 2504JD4-2]
MRYKEYNVNKVLEKAMVLFWQNGFNGCPISELVDETGVNRFSLYHEFENKQGILYHSLNLYRARYCDENHALLDAKGNLEAVLKDFYLSFLQKNRPIPGCYFIHIGTELADTDVRVKTSVDNYLMEIYSRFVNLLHENGVGASKSEFKARHLLGLYITAMSFCLIHTETERDRYITNGINLIVA